MRVWVVWGASGVLGKGSQRRSNPDSRSPLRMPWQGDTNNMIDRFDVRAHLDHIPDYTPPLLTTV